MEVLLFQLYGPMASWGTIALGSHRGTQDHPTRSAVLGLVGAALGIAREDEEGLAALSDGYAVACRTWGSLRLLSDYHTTHAIPTGGVPPWTRREGLARVGRQAGAILSRREYLMDTYVVVALWAEQTPRWGLEEVAAALSHPVFPLALGRRSCPPALPLFPQVQEAQNPLVALRQVRFPDESRLRTALCENRDRRRVHLYWEGDFEGEMPAYSQQRRDVAASRRAWTFSERWEHMRQEEVSYVP